MAIVATLRSVGPTQKIWDLTALDADTQLVLPHTYGVAPLIAFIQTRGAILAAGAAPLWTIGLIDATNITINKTTVAGSGGAVPGTTIVGTLITSLPHTATA